MRPPTTPFPRGGARTALALAALFCFAARIAVLLWADHIYDDAFIPWRMARHLAEGEGAVFNVGQRVQASTSLPHVLLCAFWWKLAGPLGMCADRVFACLVDALTVASVARSLLRSESVRLGREAALWGCAAFTAYYSLASESALVIPSGLETALYNAAIAQSLLAWAEGRDRAFGAWSAWGAMLRPDGALLVVFACATAALQRRRTPALICAALFVPFLCFQTYYYGSPIAQSVVAKGLIAHSPWRSWTTLVRTFAWGRAQPCIAAIALVGVGYGARTPFARAIALWGALYAAALATFTSFWPWYWAPLNLAFACALGFGVAHTFKALSDALERPRIARAAIGLALALTCGELGTVMRADVPYVSAHRHVSEAQDLRIAAFLNENTPADSRILVERLGVLAFHTERRFDDYPGLVSPAVTNALKRLGRPVGFGPADSEALRAIVRDVAPSHLVLRRYEFAAASAADVLSDYALVQIFPAEAGGAAFAPEHTEMMVLARRLRSGDGGGP